MKCVVSANTHAESIYAQHVGVFDNRQMAEAAVGQIGDELMKKGSIMMKHKLSRLNEKVWMGLAWLLPKQLVYWASIRLIAHATTGKFGNTVVPELSGIEALNRWNQ